MRSPCTSIPHSAAFPIFPLTWWFTGERPRSTSAGCMFVAVRGEPLFLKTIPAAWVKLDATFASSRPITQLEYLTPPVASEEIPSDAIGSSVLVVRSDREPFASGRDLYDFSQLSPGWVVESLQLNQFGVRCPGNKSPRNRREPGRQPGRPVVFPFHGRGKHVLRPRTRPSISLSIRRSTPQGSGSLVRQAHSQ